MMLLIGMRNNKGFLLLEVIISLGILSVALVLILNSFMRSIKAIDYSEDYFKAGLLLEEKIYEIHNIDIEEALREGVFTNFGNNFSWNLDIRELEEDKLDEVNVEVLWNETSKKENLSILTYLKVEP